MKICSDVDGVILDYLQGFIDFTRREKISFSHDPEIWGVIRNFPNNEEVADQFLRGDDLRKLNYFDDSQKNSQQVCYSSQTTYRNCIFA